MFTSFKLFNSNNLIWQWDFQTLATPVANEIIHFHHEMMILFIFICFFIFFNYFLSKNVIIKKNFTNKKFNPTKKQNQRRFSTLPNKPNPIPVGAFSWIKQFLNKMMKSFIQNSFYQQHVLFLLNFVIIAALLLKNYAPHVLFLTLISMFVFGFFLKYAREFFEQLKNAFLKIPNLRLYGLLFLCILFSGLIYQEMYQLLTLYTLLLGLFGLKEFYIKKYPSSFLADFYNDNKIITYHFKKEFILFYELKNINGIFILFICIIKFIERNHMITDVTVMKFLDHFLVILFAITIPTTLMLVYILWVILYFCNPVSKTAAAQIGAAITGTALLAITGAMDHHGRLVEPSKARFDIPLLEKYADDIQLKNLHYTTNDMLGKVLGDEFVRRTRHTPPTLPGGLIDSETTRMLLEALDEKEALEKYPIPEDKELIYKDELEALRAEAAKKMIIYTLQENVVETDAKVLLDPYAEDAHSSKELKK